jgi:GTP-binding protein HflX
VEAFQATLQEASEATLLLHVVDAASQEREDNQFQVHEVLEEIHAGDVPALLVFNKIDLLEQPPRIDRNDDGQPERVWVSAQTGEGIELLLQAINELLVPKLVEGELCLTPQENRLRAKLFDQGGVLDETFDEAGNCKLQIKLPQKDFHQLLAALDIQAGDLRWSTKS